MCFIKFLSVLGWGAGASRVVYRFRLSRLRSSGLSWTCPEGNLPPFLNSTFTPKRIKAAATRATDSANVITAVPVLFMAVLAVWPLPLR